MATRDGIRQAWDFLKAAGARPPQVDDVKKLGQVWLDLLSDVRDDDLESAVRQYVKDTSPLWWPDIGAIRQRTPGGRREAADDSEYAWGWLLEQVRRRGNYNPPEAGEFPPAIEAAMRAVGGWRHVCQSEVNDAPLRAAFRSAYKAAVQVNPDQRQALPGRPLRLLPGGKP